MQTEDLKTRLGKITFEVPQVRDGSFYPGALEKGLRSEGALTVTLAEMYMQGVSTSEFYKNEDDITPDQAWTAITTYAKNQGLSPEDVKESMEALGIDKETIV
jgi:hypothetical protein